MNLLSSIMTASVRREDLLRTRLNRFTRSLPGVQTGDMRAIHRARVASRRLRELLPVLGLSHGAAAKLSRRLRKTTRRLGAIRELDVLLALIEDLRTVEASSTASLQRVADE